MRFVLGFSLILLVPMCVSVRQVFAKAPTTPKILFTSAREGKVNSFLAKISINPQTQ